MPTHQHLVANVLRQNCNCANGDGNTVWKKKQSIQAISLRFDKNDKLPPIQWWGGTLTQLAFKSKSGLQIVPQFYKLKLKEKKHLSCTDCFNLTLFTSFHFPLVLSLGNSEIVIPAYSEFSIP